MATTHGGDHRSPDEPYGSLRYRARDARPFDYRSLITLDPAKRSGKPCVRELRITVYDVLDYLAAGMTEAEILADFPDLTAEDIRACLAFAAERERRLISSAL